jgi:hypothetical protein
VTILGQRNVLSEGEASETRSADTDVGARAN